MSIRDIDSAVNPGREYGLIALVLVYSAYVAEVYRAGIPGSDPGAGPPETIFGAPRHERTKGFLRRIVEAGRAADLEART